MFEDFEMIEWDLNVFQLWTWSLTWKKAFFLDTVTKAFKTWSFLSFQSKFELNNFNYKFESAILTWNIDNLEDFDDFENIFESIWSFGSNCHFWKSSFCYSELQFLVSFLIILLISSVFWIFSVSKLLIMSSSNIKSALVTFF